MNSLLVCIKGGNMKENDLDDFFNAEIINDDYDYKLTEEEIALLSKHGKAINKKLNA